MLGSIGKTEINSALENVNLFRPVGRVCSVHSGSLLISGINADAHIGDRVLIRRRKGPFLVAEVVRITQDGVHVLPDGAAEGVGIDDRAILTGPVQIAPTESWLGRIINSDGQSIDGRPLEKGTELRPLQSAPPAPADRQGLGARLETGYALFNTILPLVRGQRMGLFSGSGVGKSSLIGKLATNVDSDVVVIALVGERGRELRHFVDDVLGPIGLSRAVVVAETSDQSPLSRRRCAWTAMTVAEYFRDQGKSVLLMMDSVTRFAEAHREISVAAGEAPVLRGYPPSTAHFIMSLCERAGPGSRQQGTITGIFSVLVAGSDLEEPIADILRGVLDGHVVLDREIAERGRFPAVNILKSVSRSLPNCASEPENSLIGEAKKYLSTFEKNSMMVSAGLYSKGSDQGIDRAIEIWPDLDGFATRSNEVSIEDSFARLSLILKRAKFPKISQ